MALYKLGELVAYQLAMDLKKQVLELIYNSPAQHDTKLAGQISDAASSVGLSGILCVGFSMRSFYAPQTESPD